MKEMEHTASSTYVDCGGVKPSAALGGRMVGILKSCLRFLGSLPARSLDWAQSFTLVTFCTNLYLLALYTLARLSFFDGSTVCLSTNSILNHYQGEFMCVALRGLICSEAILPKTVWVQINYYFCRNRIKIMFL